MDYNSRAAPSRRHVLIGTGVVMGTTALAAAGVHLWRSDDPGPAPAGSPDSELDALADAAVSAGPRRDGIPPIDEPRFVDADAADFLIGDEPVFGCAIAVTSRPIRSRCSYGMRSSTTWWVVRRSR